MMKNDSCIWTWLLIALLLVLSFWFLFGKKGKEGMVSSGQATCTDNSDGTTTCVDGCTTIILYPDGTSKTTNTCLKTCDLATNCDQCLNAWITDVSTEKNPYPCYWSDEKYEYNKMYERYQPIEQCSLFQDELHSKKPCDERNSPEPSPNPSPSPSPNRPWPHPNIDPEKRDPDDNDDHNVWPKPKPGPTPNPIDPQPSPSSNCPTLTMLKGPVFINSSALPQY